MELQINKDHWRQNMELQIHTDHRTEYAVANTYRSQN